VEQEIVRQRKEILVENRMDELGEIFSSNTFDTKTALSGLYLWLLFGYLSTMVSCDLQRWMKDSLLFRHFVGIIAFFFLFTVLDTSNKAPIGALWIKTFFIYAIFLMMVKSKWYFAVPVLLLLVGDQSLRAHADYIGKDGKDKKLVDQIEIYRQMINKLIIALVVGGFFHYMFRQWNEFGDQFSFSTFLFSYGCSNL
jgi:hypothetical protein